MGFALLFLNSNKPVGSVIVFEHICIAVLDVISGIAASCCFCIKHDLLSLLENIFFSYHQHILAESTLQRSPKCFPPS